jgi:Tol biopolymer transport system component
MAKWHYTETQRSEGQPNLKGRRASILIPAFCTAGLLLASQARNASVPAQQRYSIVFTQVPASALSGKKQGMASAFRKSLKEKSRIVALSAGGSIAILTPEFAAAATPSLSFDGKSLLFAGKKEANENWNIWEMDVDGRNKKQITRDFGNCAEPRYLALGAVTPPEFADKVRWISFSSDAANVYDELGTAPATSLYVRNLEPVEGRGLFTRRITFTLSSVFSPIVLRDGRILFGSHQPAGGSFGNFPFMVTNWDGTGLNLFYRTRSGTRFNAMACELPDRTLVFVESDGTGPDPGGQLARVSFARPLNSYEVVSKESGRYCDPRQLPDRQLLVSFRDGKESYGLYLFDFDAGAPGKKIYDDPKWDELEGLPVISYAEPQGLISAVVDSESSGDLQCLNVYDSDTPAAMAIKEGEVKSVRLVEGVPYSTREKMPGQLVDPDTFPRVKTRILGEAPVEPDGSFFVRVPADTPFFIQTLDTQGMVLQTQRSWMWVRRGTSRGCVGCHENKELAPENRSTQALIKAQRASLLAPVQERKK